MNGNNLAFAEHDRFSDYFGSLRSIVTSSAQNDSGLFETNLRDERYLPFENSGVTSEWQLELPANSSKNEPAQFDYDTISDVILHIRYTAREDGSLLRNAAMKELDELIKAGQATGSVRLFSVRHEFPSEWHRFKTQTNELSLTLRPEHYPFWAQGRVARGRVTAVTLLARSEQMEVSATIGSDGIMLQKDAALGNLLIGKFTNIAPPAKPTGELKLSFNTKELSDLWIAVSWK